MIYNGYEGYESISQPLDSETIFHKQSSFCCYIPFVQRSITITRRLVRHCITASAFRSIRFESSSWSSTSSPFSWTDLFLSNFSFGMGGLELFNFCASQTIESEAEAPSKKGEIHAVEDGVESMFLVWNDFLIRLSFWEILHQTWKWSTNKFCTKTMNFVTETSWWMIEVHADCSVVARVNLHLRGIGERFNSSGRRQRSCSVELK